MFRSRYVISKQFFVSFCFSRRESERLGGGVGEWGGGRYICFQRVSSFSVTDVLSCVASAKRERERDVSNKIQSGIEKGKRVCVCV